MFKSKLLDICLQLQTNEKDKERCHELFNEISDLKNFMIESIKQTNPMMIIYQQKKKIKNEYNHSIEFKY